MVPARSRPLGWAVALILAAAYGWWAVALPPFSAQATVAVLLPGGTATIVGTRYRRPPRGREPTAGTGWWALLASAVGAWQLAAYLQQPRADHPTLSSLADQLLDWRPARALGFLAWMVIGADMARR